MKHLLHYATLALLLSLFPFSLAAKVVGSGSCGDNLTWSYDDETYELKIEGSGNMRNYASSGYAPWYSYRSKILKLSLPSELTTIGNYAFYGCSGLTSVTIPNSVTSIGNVAFADCM